MKSLIETNMKAGGSRNEIENGGTGTSYETIMKASVVKPLQKEALPASESKDDLIARQAAAIE